LTEQVTKSSPLVAALLESVEARLDGVTEGPWMDANCGDDCCVWIESAGDPGGQLAGVDSIANAKFMAHARTAVPALVALARQQDAKLMAIRRLVEASEEDRRVRQDGQPFAQFADSVIGTEELRALLDTTSES
jgi:hypothetical protein